MAKKQKNTPSQSAPYRVITGEFHLFSKTAKGLHSGSQPDGDTIKFKPDRGKKAFAPIEKKPVPGGMDPGTKPKPRGVEFNDAGHCNLRFDAIDALELHFQGAQQNDALARQARELMLSTAGFASTEFAPKKFLEVRSATPHPINGYIISKGIDPYGRVVSFVFTGKPPKKDGSVLFLSTTQVRASINAGMLRAGHAQPAFYAGMPTDLRNTLAAESAKSRKPSKGLWVGFTPKTASPANSLKQLETSRIWPKLFRRLVNYFKDKPSGNLSGFDDWLRKRSDDDVIWLIPKMERGNLHDVYKVAGGSISMVFEPSELIIVPR